MWRGNLPIMKAAFQPCLWRCSTVEQILGNTFPFLLFVGTFKLHASFLISLPPQQLSLLSACVAPSSKD